jgi:hypothetical protein
VQLGHRHVEQRAALSWRVAIAGEDEQVERDTRASSIESNP